MGGVVAGGEEAVAGAAVLGAAGDAAKGERRHQLSMAQKKLCFMGSWWTNLEHSERCMHLAGLQFALRRESERRASLSASGKAQGISAQGGLVQSVSPLSGVGASSGQLGRKPGALVQELD